MIAIMTIIYTGIVLMLFKFKLLKPRPFPIAGVMVVGVLILGGIAVTWMISAPLSSKVVTTQYVVQLVPYVKGQVKKVHAQPNHPLKKGDLLLEIEPAPYQYTVNQLESQLRASKAGVNQAQAGLEAAEANVGKSKDGVVQAHAALDQAKAAVTSAQSALNKAKAANDLAKTEELIAINLQKADAGAISVLKVTEARQKRIETDAVVDQADAAVTGSKAGQQQAVAALAAAQSSQRQAEAAERQAAFALQVAQSNVPAVEAQLDDARFNLAQCRMYSPGDGYVVNWQVQEGTMIASNTMSAAGTFINTSETAIVAIFPQNYVANVAAGDEVEVVLDPYPGRLFKGVVDTVITATGEGQFTPGGKIPEALRVGSQGLFAVKILLTDEAQPATLPLGAGGSVTIYTKTGKPFHVISKVAIRMDKWLLYVKPSLPQKP